MMNYNPEHVQSKVSTPGDGVAVPPFGLSVTTLCLDVFRSYSLYL